MANSLYKKTCLAMVAGILIALPAIGRQDAKKDKTKEAAVEAKVSAKQAEALTALRKQQDELRQKQRDLNRQLSELNQKLAVENRKLSQARVQRYDSIARIQHIRIDSLTKRDRMVLSLRHDSLRNLVFRDSLRSINGRVLQLTGKNLAINGRALQLTGKNLAINGRIAGVGTMNGINLDRDYYNPNYQGIEKTKTYSKSYSVSSDDKLAVNNQYGKVTINTWDKKEIKVDVEIKAYDSSDDEAQKLLDGVKIEDSKISNVVSFKTTIERGKNTNWWTRTVNGKTESHGVRVNYIVYMPAKSSLDVSNTYGAVVMPDMSGPLKVRVMYGSLKGGNLSNPANEIKTSYSPVQINSIESGTVNVEYGRADIGTASNLNLTLSNAANSRIGKLTNGGDLKLNYSGGFRIDQLSSQLKNMTVVSTYSPKLTINPGGANFDFDVSVNYATFNYNQNDKVNMVKDGAVSGRNYTSQTYKGQYGKSSDSRVTIRATYGSVQFL